MNQRGPLVCVYDCNATHVVAGEYMGPLVHMYICVFLVLARTYKEIGVNISIRIKHHLLLLFKVKENRCNQF